MPKMIQEVESPKLQPYIYHGVDLSTTSAIDEVLGECPFCAKVKFYLNTRTGLWDCKVCASKGNVYSFLRLLWEESLKTTKDYSQLLVDRKLLKVDTLIKWGVARSISTFDWIIPGYNAQGKLCQLYRYLKDKTGKRRFIPTPGLSSMEERHGYHMVSFDPKKPDIAVCEGPFDGMALWEVMGSSRRSDSGDLVQTDTESLSLRAKMNIIAVPGCNVFYPSWATLFGEKHVTLFYDSDHPHEHPQGSGRFTQPGWDAMKRVSGILSAAEKKPESVECVRWGENGYDANKVSGWDVRDYLSDGEALKSMGARVKALSSLLLKVTPIPDNWLLGRNPETASKGGLEIDCLPCSDWKTLVQAWRKALDWSEGLDRALSMMLACITSTKSVGDQLWAKIVGPPACGKSTLCEALSVCKKYVFANSTMTGFHSGYKSDKTGEEDHSLVAKIKDKTLVTKDGDTLLQAPNKDKILSEARDLYDRVARPHYGHGLNRVYEGWSMTWLLCGTESLRALDTSELGERFLDCVIVDKIDEDSERRTALRVAYRAAREMSMISDGSVDTRDGPEMVYAKQLTGGYVTYLRDNAQQLLDEVSETPEAMERCVDLGTFVAHVRARPSTKQDENVQRELCYRLTSQIVRLAKCLAVVLNRRDLDEEVMRRTTRVAMDTARGRTLEIVKFLYNSGKRGDSSGAVALHMHSSREKEIKMLTFLRRLGVVESFKNKSDLLTYYRLTEKMRSLYEVVTGITAEIEEEV